ncbi:hypothetical protein R3P38DRAFT_2843187 [Favolaschia claudopus]|uniref:Uncharacterized protein n=1 Tax=Favolaschia claudopus TaxID=2862362 RepID=A0AAW0E100_9AGAR
MSRMRRVKTTSLNPQFLREGWTSDTRKYGVLEYIVSTVNNSNNHNWSTVETWGVEVNRTGERRFARHIRLTGSGGLEMERHLVYNYLGEIL